MKYLMMELSRVVGLVVCLAVLASLSGCKPTISFTALESILTPGQETELEWEVEFAKGSGDNVIEISPDVGVVELEGIVTVAPTETTTYKMSTRSFVFGFPMFVKEELTIEVEEGVCWDFTRQADPDICKSDTEWDLYAANYIGDDETDYKFQKEKYVEVPGLGYQAMLFEANHDDRLEGESLIMFGTVRWAELEDETDYKVKLSVVYAMVPRPDEDDNKCKVPTIELSAYIGLEEPEVETDSDKDNVKSVINLDLEDKHTLSTDITIVDATDDPCDEDGVFEESSASVSEVDVTTDSDGEFWITIALTPSTPNMTVYLRSVTAIFQEQ